MINNDYGNIQLNINRLLKLNGFSKNYVCKELNLSRKNFNRYCNNDIQRIDKLLLCKLCYIFNCKIEDIIEYKP